MLAHAKVVSLYARKFGTGQWSFIGPGSEKKWYSMKEDSPQGIWDKIAEKMLLEFAESGCPIFRATTPFSRGQLKSKGHGKLSIHYAADQKTIETIFRIIVSASQLILYGAVAEMCEEYESIHDRTGRHDTVMGQSIVLSEIKTEVSLDCDDPTNQDLLLQQYGERIEKFQVHREEDGAVHFWRIKENLQNQFPQSIHWSDDRWKACLAAGGGAKRRYQYCTYDTGIIVYFRALQGTFRTQSY